MKSIRIPHKTFLLYVKGARTFIHIPKECNDLDDSQFDEEICVIDNKTGECIIQNFSFLYDLKEITRFKFVVFRCDDTSSLFLKRKNYRHNLLASGNGRFHMKPSDFTEKALLFSDQNYSFDNIKRNQVPFLISRNNLFSLNDLILFPEELPLSVKKTVYVVIDVLGIYENNSKSSPWFCIHSLLSFSSPLKS